ncbi:MAG: efflux RND transporter periplasmic adaptor subunit [Desulfopila sp.]
MNMIRPDTTSSSGEIQRNPSKIAGFLLHFLVPALILASGAAITAYLLRTPPQAHPVKRMPVATMVEVQTIHPGRQQALLDAMGEIVPAREIELKPRVSGEVVGISSEFVPGGFFQAGQVMLNIDPVDYKLSLAQLTSEVEKVRSDIVLEMGNQRIAEKEFALLGESVSPEERKLILRQPQLVKLKATLASIESQQAQARIDLTRTEIRAPFNAVVNSREADIGAKVNESTVLATLVGTDTFWLRLAVPVEQLPWIRIPQTDQEEGSQVRVYPTGDAGGTNTYRTGRVIRLAASLEPQGRMAQLLVAIDDPFCRKEENAALQPLLLGSFVKAEILGRTVDNGFALDRSYLHDGNSVWLMDDAERLAIQEVEILFRNRQQVIVGDGLVDGQRLVISQLASPIAGTPLRLAEEGKATTGSRRSESTGQPAQGKGGNRGVE